MLQLIDYNQPNIIINKFLITSIISKIKNIMKLPNDAHNNAPNNLFIIITSYYYINIICSLMQQFINNLMKYF